VFKELLIDNLPPHCIKLILDAQEQNSLLDTADIALSNESEHRFVLANTLIVHN
jgi:hypothetical protein